MKRHAHPLSCASKPFTQLCTLGLLALACPVLAGEIVLYEHNRFHGRSLTLHEAMNDLADVRFANEVSSIIVKSGTWTLCSDRNHRGTCRTYSHGDYPQIDDLNDNVRSVRELKTRPQYQQPGPSRPGSRDSRDNRDSSPSITLYEHGNFAGRSVSLDGPVNSLESIGMNDIVSSVVVRGGIWELCMHADFQPPCRQFGPGDHWEVGERFNDQFSSARSVGGSSSYPSTPAPSRPDDNDGSRADAILFDAENFHGSSRSLSSRVDSFESIDFNDRTSSIIVNRGTWLFCSDANFRGSCQSLGPGRYGSLDGDLHNRISSARPDRGRNNTHGNWGGSSGWRGGNWSGSRGSVTLYEYEDFIGRSFNITGPIQSLDAVGFNDRASSVIVRRGRWEFCTDAHFHGTCRTVGPGRYESLPQNMDSKISSARQIGP